MQTRVIERIERRRARSEPRIPGSRASHAEWVRERISHDGRVQESARALADRWIEFREEHLIHAYVYRGRRQILDPVTGVLFSASEAEHLLAMGVSSGLGAGEISRIVTQIGEERAATLLRDLRTLAAENGMFLRSKMLNDQVVENAINAYVAHRPRKMMLCVSQTCNLRCIYCYAIEGNYHDEGRKMDLATAKQAVRYLAKRSGRRRRLTITLFGGEPLLNFDMIKELVPWAQEWTKSIGKAVHFCITTNGTLLSEEIIEFLVHHNFSIMISLDGPEEVQDFNRPNAGGSGSFKVAAPKIKRLFELHPHAHVIKVRATMTREHHDTRKLSEFFEEFGFKRIGLGSNLGYSFHKGPQDLGEKERLEIYDMTEDLLDDRILEATRNYERLTYNPLIESLVVIHRESDRQGAKLRMPCGVGRNDQGIDVDGKVYPCHRYVGLESYVMGDIWNGLDTERVTRFYRQIFEAYTHCDGCWANHWCSGHCPNYLSDPTGKLFGPDEPACDMIRGNLERNLALYEEFNETGMNWDRAASEMTEL